jgi:ElaB/YqjD/DUF883 family membrane-anchored ribosome-binding protein
MRLDFLIKQTLIALGVLISAIIVGQSRALAVAPESKDRASDLAQGEEPNPFQIDDPSAFRSEPTMLADEAPVSTVATDLLQVTSTDVTEPDAPSRPLYIGQAEDNMDDSSDETDADSDIEETTEEIDEDLDEAGDDINDATDDVDEDLEDTGDDIDDAVDDVDEDLDETGDDIDDAADDVGDDVDDAVDDIGDDLDDIGDDINDVIDDIGDDIDDAVDDVDDDLDEVGDDVDDAVDDVGDDIDEATDDAETQFETTQDELGLEGRGASPNFIGVGGNIGIGGDTALGDSSFAIVGKITVAPSVSLRPGLLIEDGVTILAPVTYDFAGIETDLATFYPFAGAGTAVSFDDDDSEFDLLLTVGVDIPLSNDWAITSSINAGVFDSFDIGALLGIVYTF